MNEISEIEEEAGVQTITYPYTGNSAFGKAAQSAEKDCGKIKIIRIETKSWMGTIVVYQMVR